MRSLEVLVEVREQVARERVVQARELREALNRFKAQLAAEEP